MEIVESTGPSLETDALVALEEKGLTRREVEVLEWVARGKTIVAVDAVPLTSCERRRLSRDSKG